ncbi:MAG TPA: hypothetical protein VGX92_18650 [Pyrinomonadaceae bacterium]|jgi:uncharacterized protein (TIGR00290 family)|nr:hypothetical protein [Pyrinomonadaceae bacterium]
MLKKTLLSWSSGKDSAWALNMLRRQADIEVVGLLTTVNECYRRIAIHAVRLELLLSQAEAVGLPLHIVNLPSPCSNLQYEAAMHKAIEKARLERVECIAFGDLFLQDIREYRESMLAGTGITPLFPLWNIPTDRLAHQMIAGGLRARLSCIDPRQLPASFAGREFDESFISELPVSVDPCGERGEFHTFAFAGPMFNRPVDVQVGDIVEREGFIYADILPVPNNSLNPTARDDPGRSSH